MSELSGTFRITHPFHPRRDEELELLGYRRGFGSEVVDGRDASGAVVTVPLGFTDAASEEDPFLVISEGRALFRGEDLLDLAALLAELRP